MKKICSILLALILAIMPLTLCAAESTGKVTLNYYGWTDEQSYMTALIDCSTSRTPTSRSFPPSSTTMTTIRRSSCWLLPTPA